MKIEREPISSSAIKTLGHDEPSLSLDVEFNSGQVWRYQPVPRETFLRMRDPSLSAGKIFHTEIRLNPRVNGEQLVAKCDGCGGEFTCPEWVCPTAEAAS